MERWMSCALAMALPSGAIFCELDIAIGKDVPRISRPNIRVFSWIKSRLPKFHPNGVAQNGVDKAILTGVIAKIPLGSLLADLMWLRGAERGIFGQRQAFTAHTGIQVLATGGNDNFLYGSTDTAIQDVEPGF